ncbi:hypothetical protein HK101_010382 [Irineochytrium annulatum]|nr:hypothetical protein HK101_010382 [Irineochytrium annulatum]
MLLMMGGSLLLFLIVPKMMSNMDPETLKEMQERHKTQKKVEMPDLSQLAADFLSPSTKKQ